MDVKVNIFLIGGYHYQVTLSVDEPLLKDLFGAVAAKTQGVPNNWQQLFQVPINKGQSVLLFPSHHLVGISTDPPLAVKQIDDSLLSDSWFFPAPQAEIVEAQYVEIDNFLTPAENRLLLNAVLQKESAFLPSGHAGTYDRDRRRSKVSVLPPGDVAEIQKRIRSRLPDLFNQFGISPFIVGEIETQVTASNDGDFYKLHQDRGQSLNVTRELTYVYYFHREPKPFSGGELLIYDETVEENGFVKADSYKRIEPYNNRIVFFPSQYWHEVLPVSCPSQSFADSRFTINGWVRRQPETTLQEL